VRSVRGPCYHEGQEVQVGSHTVWAGGYYLSDGCLDKVDALVALGSKLPVEPGGICPKPLVWLPLTDFGGVPSNWREIVEGKIIPLLQGGCVPAVFCHAGHGRTGTLLASLVALLEGPRDPIQTVRERYCLSAVETHDQAEAVFALQGRRLPQKYHREFRMTSGAAPLRKGKS
jgi:hypothetical protein